MAALSRNTASVAQDFHNAGDGVQTFNSSSVHVAEDNYKKIIIKHMKTAACVDEPWRDFPVNPVLLDTLMKRLDQTTVDSSKSSKPRTSENVSSPASNPIKKEPNSSGKSRSSHNKTKSKKTHTSTTSPTTPPRNRKRRKVSHEKENEHIQPKAKVAKVTKEMRSRNSTLDNKIRSQFDDGRSPKRLKTLGSTIQTPSSGDNNNKKDYKLAEDLSRSEKEDLRGDTFTISVFDKVASNDLPSGPDSAKVSRKELVKDSIEKDPTKIQQESSMEMSSCPNIKLESLPQNHTLSPPNTPCPAPSQQSTPSSALNSTYNGDDSIQAQIRDKHLNRMVSKKLSCRQCISRNRCMVLPYHTKATLLLHTLWHHTGKQYQCNHPSTGKSSGQRCQNTFQKKYQLQLHHRIAHRCC